MKTFTRPVGFKSSGEAQQRESDPSRSSSLSVKNTFQPSWKVFLGRKEISLSLSPLSNRSGISSTYIPLVKTDYPWPSRISLSLSSSFLLVSFYLFPSFATFGVTAAVLKIGVRWFGNVHRCFCTATITRACARINRCKRLSY